MRRAAHHLGLAVALCVLGVVFWTAPALADDIVLCKTWTGYVKARYGSCRWGEKEILLPDTLADLSCAEDQIVRYVGGQWVCSDEGAAYVKTECADRTWDQGQRNQFRVNCDGPSGNPDFPISGGCELAATGAAALLVHSLHGPAFNTTLGFYNGWICGYRMPPDNANTGTLIPADAQSLLPVTREICTTVICIPRNPEE